MPEATPLRLVLVVDDEFLIRWSLRQQLERAGYRVLEAEDGLTAMRMFSSEVDLIMLDFRLPDINGLEVLERVRATGATTPVIMLTAHASPRLATLAKRAGATQLAGKPFDLDEVVNLVHAAVA